MSKSIYDLARKAVNNHIELYTARLNTAEYASTRLATSLINGDWLPVMVVVYDDDQTELAGVIVSVPSLERAWRFVLSQFGNIPPKNIGMAYLVNDFVYAFQDSDIEAAYENVRYESEKERARHLNDGKGDSNGSGS